MLYRYSGGFDAFPAFREAQEAQGVVFNAISTLGDVLILDTDSTLDLPIADPAPEG